MMKMLTQNIFVILMLLPVFSVSADDMPPFYAAEEFFPRDEMREARNQTIHHNGGQINSLIMAERLEYQSNEGNSLFYSEIQGWIGTDADRIWIKSEVEYLNGKSEFEEFELQTLYSKPVSTFFDAQFGIRHDFDPDPSRSFGVLGLQGLAPYWFEIDLASFVSEDGDVSFRTEFETDLLVTQRLILQPRAELNFAVQDVQEYAIEGGLTDFDIGLRLRYEIVREIAPYIGISWNQLTGGTRRLAVSDGEEASVVSFVSGVRIWF